MSGIPQPPAADDVIARALAEDFGVAPEVFLAEEPSPVLERDVTTHAVVPAGAMWAGSVVARASGVVCGVSLALRAWELAARVAGRAAELRVAAVRPDGEVVAPGDVVARVAGPAPVILGAERTALNVLMVLSGIATEAQRWQQAAGPRVTVLDTRKTLPGLRAVSKWAVEIGGATPHRAGLWDMVLVKDNHIRAAGGIAAAVESARAGAPGLLVEVEADTIAEAEGAVAAGADIVLLDNMAPESLAGAVTAVRMASVRSGRACLTEASGGIVFDDVAEVAATGVDRISTSALTLAPPLDFGLDEDPPPGGAGG